jgi:hypothetical protein
MLLNDQEFLQIKDNYVADVLERLRHLAQLEGEIILKEYHSPSNTSGHHATLPEISVLVSKAILRVKDALFQCGQLDVYSQPLPEHSDVSSPVEGDGGFFIGSSSSRIASPTGK